jgi:hypothetical protein
MIRSVLLAALSLVVMVLVGCDTINSDHWHIQRPLLPAPRSEQVMVVHALVVEIAGNFGLADQTPTSRDEGTIAYCVEGVEHFPIFLGARTAGNVVVIDLSQFHPGGGELEKYKSLKARLLATLDEKFPGQVTQAKVGERIEIVVKPKP